MFFLQSLFTGTANDNRKKERFYGRKINSNISSAQNHMLRLNNLLLCGIWMAIYLFVGADLSCDGSITDGK